MNRCRRRNHCCGAMWLLSLLWITAPWIQEKLPRLPRIAVRMQIPDVVFCRPTTAGGAAAVCHVPLGRPWSPKAHLARVPEHTLRMVVLLITSPAVMANCSPVHPSRLWQLGPERQCNNVYTRPGDLAPLCCGFRTVLLLEMSDMPPPYALNRSNLIHAGLDRSSAKLTRHLM